MMKFRIYLLSILFASFIITGCEKDDATVNEAEVLVEYLESTDSPLMKDFVNTDMPTMITASDLNSLNLTNQAYIIDIRSAADFAAGHIANAHNVALADVLTHVKGADLTGITKIAVVCYTGQTAGFAASVLRLMGYDNAFDLKFGMCAWNDATATKWKNTIAAGNTYATRFTPTAATKAEAGSLPVLSTGFKTGQDILEARAQAVLTEGFSAASISNATVFANLDDYYIVNYWSEAHYTDPGHIPGSIQYTPKESLKLDADLLTLPTDKPIVVYCYTGQTSAFLAAYLRMVGYDAKSLLYGANGMIYDIMLNKSMTTFKASDINNYPLVVTTK